MKKCKKCGKTRSVGDFHKAPRNKDGLFSMCKECRNKYDRKFYQDGRKTSGRVDLKYRKIIHRYKRIKGCSLCNETEPSCLDLHHKDPSQKEMEVSMMVRAKGWEKIKKEVRKCLVICANCHRKLHAGIISI